MRNTLKLFLFPTLFLFFACSKNNDGNGNPQKNGQVSIHRLSKTILKTGVCEVDTDASEIDDAPIVRNEEILGYSQNDYQFFVSTNAHKRIEAMGDGSGFVVVVNNSVIYYGIFKPMTSSLSCDNSITMSAWKINNETRLDINLGYPGSLPGSTITDNRNDEALIKVLRNQGKLR